jgi:hypothetical protein
VRNVQSRLVTRRHRRHAGDAMSSNLLGEFTRDQYVNMLVRAGVARSYAEKAAAEKYGTIEAKQLDAEALESAHVKEGDRIVLALRGKITAFSQYRRAKQTPGIADRLYRFPQWGFSLWWEAKAAWGEASPAQKEWHADAIACGEEVVVGELCELKDALRAHGICRFNPDGSLEPVHQPEV